MVPMRDGVKLATDIYLPAHDGMKLDGKFPVIFQRTPYNKEPKNLDGIDFYCKNGYVVVIQDCRGRYHSEGVFSKYVNEPKDGYDAIERNLSGQEELLIKEKNLTMEIREKDFMVPNHHICH